VRDRARRAGLPVFDKRTARHLLYWRASLPGISRPISRAPSGPIESPEGEVLGTHQGLAFYTLGQREGLHIVADADVWTSLGI